MTTTTRRGPAAKQPVLAAGASAPPKVYRTMNMTLELIPIEVGIYSSVAEPEGLRKEFIRGEDGSYHEVGRKSYNKTTGEIIEDTSQVIKGVNTPAGVVEVTDQDLALATEKVCQIEGFINLASRTPEELRLICPTKFYQVRPGKMKVGKDYRVNRQAEEVFTLLLSEMEAAQAHAILRITMKDGEAAKLGLMDWAGQLRLLAFENCIRAELPLGERPDKPKLQTMMSRLIKRHMKTSLPANPDLSAVQVEKILQMKAAGGELVAPTGQPNRNDHPAMDLEAALQAALNRTKVK